MNKEELLLASLKIFDFDPASRYAAPLGIQNLRFWPRVAKRERNEGGEEAAQRGRGAAQNNSKDYCCDNFLTWFKALKRSVISGAS